MLNSVEIDKTLESLKQSLSDEKNLSPTLKALIEVLMVIVQLLSNRVGLNSQNSSKPPSSDPNRLKSTRKPSTNKKGGQKGHPGKTLTQVDDPCEIETIKIDRRTLPAGKYKDIGFEKRQIVDIEFVKKITEYQAQILQDSQGKRFVASFPAGVNKAVQYGNELKAHAVYLSQYQLLPYKRIQEHFVDQLDIPISQASIVNFNQQAFKRLAEFNQLAKKALSLSYCLHADETGVNIDGKRHWLHCASNTQWTDFSAHKKRGVEAMDAAGILPGFEGTLCHDHWKPYYRYKNCQHSLCNAHHLRELTRAYEQDNQKWAEKVKEFLEIANRAVHKAGGALNPTKLSLYKKRYRRLLEKAETECPPPDEKKKGKRGRVKRSKSRNLLERLINFEDDVLRFMEDEAIPFTNNQGENDIRMTKVQQKISGCFRSQDGADVFCRVRGFLSTCRKQNVSSSKALKLLFKGELPQFAKDFLLS